MVDVGKREDRMLDIISEQGKLIKRLEHNRDEAIDWIGMAKDAGWIDAALHEHFELILLGY